MLSPLDIVRQIDGIARRDPRAEVVIACRRASMTLREGREGAQHRVLAELRDLAVVEGARPAVQSVLRWAQGQLPHMNRAL